MKTLSIALLSLKRSFRSAFALVFMFAIPLMVTGMFYLMFGNTPAPASAAVQAAPQVSSSAWVELRAPLTPAPAPASPLTQIIAPIMGGMLIFFAFFTGASTCQSDPQGRRGRHPAAPVHHPHRAALHPGRQVRRGRADRADPGGGGADRRPPGLRHPMGRAARGGAGCAGHRHLRHRLRHLPHLAAQELPPGRRGLRRADDHHRHGRHAGHLQPLRRYPAPSR